MKSRALAVPSLFLSELVKELTSLGEKEGPYGQKSRIYMAN